MSTAQSFVVSTRLRVGELALLDRLAAIRGVSRAALVGAVLRAALGDARSDLAGAGAPGGPIVDVSEARQVQLRETLRVAAV